MCLRSWLSSENRRGILPMSHMQHKVRFTMTPTNARHFEGFIIRCPCWQVVACLPRTHRVECPSRLGTWQGLSPLRQRSAGLCLGVLSGAYCTGAGLSKGRVEAVLGRADCLDAGVSTTDAGPPAGWEDVLPDALLGMARGQSGSIP